MDSYYRKEEEVVTPEEQIDTYSAQVAVTNTVEVWAKETLGGLYDQTLYTWNLVGDLRQAAEERGDVATVEHLVGIQNTLTEIYTGTQHLQEALLHSNAGAKSILEGAQVLVKQKQEVEAELSELTEAVYDADSDHPLVADLIQTVEEGAYEYAAEGLYEDAYESAQESIYSDMYRVLRELSPLATYFTMERLISTLKGDYPMDDGQRDLLLKLLQTCAPEVKAS